MHYGQAYVFSGDADETVDLEGCFRGQANGLVGAALRGELFLITRLHTGEVSFRVEAHPSKPPLDDRQTSAVADYWHRWAQTL